MNNFFSQRTNAFSLVYINQTVVRRNMQISFKTFDFKILLKKKDIYYLEATKWAGLKSLKPKWSETKSEKNIDRASPGPEKSGGFRSLIQYVIA